MRTIILAIATAALAGACTDEKPLYADEQVVQCDPSIIDTSAGWSLDEDSYGCMTHTDMIVRGGWLYCGDTFREPGAGHVGCVLRSMTSGQPDTCRWFECDEQ